LSKRRVRAAGMTAVSRTLSLKGAIWLAAAALLLLPAASLAAKSDKKMKRVEPRQQVRSIHSTYVIYQVDQEIGHEAVVRNVYTDNTVEFRATVEMHMPHGANISVESELLLQEESFFPIRYRAGRTVKQEAMEFGNSVDAEWFSNVAVVRSSAGGEEATNRVTLPTGAAVFNMETTHLLYQLLFWYDGEAGGVQSFNVFEPTSRNVSSASLRLQKSETVTIQGEEVTALRYELKYRNTDLALFVGDGGRILKVDQGFLVYELSEWSETPGQDQ